MLFVLDRCDKRITALRRVFVQEGDRDVVLVDDVMRLSPGKKLANEARSVLRLFDVGVDVNFLHWDNC